MEWLLFAARAVSLFFLFWLGAVVVARVHMKLPVPTANLVLASAALTGFLMLTVFWP